MLKQILRDNMIETDVDVNNWKEAIEAGGSILEKNQIITHDYTESMIESVKKYGPYIVIAPGIALAHGTPNKGVHKVGVSITTLKHPVLFGHDRNDPVQIVITLAAIDHDSHMEALSSLAKLLAKEEFINVLHKQNKKEIIQYIQTSNT